MPTSNRRKWPPYVNQTEFIELSYKLSTLALAARYRVDERTVRYWKYYLQEHNIEHGSGEFPGASGKKWNDYVRIQADRLLVIGDAEIPDHDPRMFDLALSVANRWDIKTLVINGDFAALDAFSAWMKQLARRRIFKDEITPTIDSLKVFLKTFTDNIIYTNGNHERRLAHAIEGQVTFGDLLAEVYGVTMSEYAYAYVTSGGKEILVCHQDNYSQIPLSVPLKLSAIHHMNIIAGHTHRLCFGYDKSGQYWLVEGGHCRDVERTAYKSLRINSHPAWNPGFVMVLDGHPYLISPHNADFWISGGNPIETPEMETEAKDRKRKPRKSSTRQKQQH